MGCGDGGIKGYNRDRRVGRHTEMFALLCDSTEPLRRRRMV